MTKKAIFPAANAIEAYRSSGYRHAASAIAELVDNSYEAKAKNVWIIVREGVRKKVREVRCIEEIHLVDDGHGMDAQTLSLALQFGGSTRQERKSLGRFGMGLPNASVSQCKYVGLYSSQGSSRFFHTYLDVDAIKSGELEEVPTPKAAQLESLFRDVFRIPLPVHGTVVEWKNIDRFDIRRTGKLFEHLSFELGRRYRYFLFNNEIKIHLISIDNPKDSREVLPVDPLHLMSPSNSPGEFALKPAFEVRGENRHLEHDFEVDGKKVGKLYFKFSKAPKEVRHLGGTSPFGTYAGKNMGVSILRNWREIDFGMYDLYAHDDRDRWWGAEVNFDSSLDELMGVNFLKQGVRFHATELKDLYEENPTLKLWAEITAILEEQISPMRAEVKSEAKKKGESGAGNGRAAGIATTVIAKSGTDPLTIDRDKVSKKSEEEKIATIAKELKENPNDPESVKLIRELLAKGYQMHLSLDSWEGPIFLSVRREGNQCFVKLNQQHMFYSVFYEPICSEADKHSIDALDLLFLSFIAAQESDKLNSKYYDHVREKWGEKLRDFLSEFKKV